MSESITLTARWVFPGDGPPLEGGLVTITDGVIAAVEPFDSRSVDRDFGEAAIIPGLVNAHTHLDLTGAKGKVPPSPDFVGWLRGVIAFRLARTPKQVREDVRQGIAESLRSGTTLLGDVAAQGATWDQLASSTLRAVVFRELLGLTEERVMAATWDAVLWRDDHKPPQPNCRAALSPHAPYSYRYQALSSLAALFPPIMIHLAESAAELELLERHSGPFVPFLAGLGAWDPTGLAWSPEHVVQLTHEANAVLYAHCNYLAPDAPIPPKGTVVYCPRTHAAFGHPPHPFRDFLARGVRVALGTDSLASNPDLSILAEMRFIHARYPDVPGATLLHMATLAGAEALDWADETGSLTPGKSADFAVVPLPNVDASDPHLLLLESDCAVRETWFRGRRIALD